MRSRLHIKGKILWRICALALVTFVFSFCFTKIVSVDMPATAVVGETVNIKLTIQAQAQFGNTNIHSNNIICAVLLPKGFKGAENLSGTFTSDIGNGTMVVLPATAQALTTGLTWQKYINDKFGIAGNLINDMEWVVMQTDIKLGYKSPDTYNGIINLKLKVGADGNATLFKPSFVICNTEDGLKEDPNFGVTQPYGVTAQYYNQYTGSCFEVTGGTGDLVDFCNPQLTSVDPPKSLDNDFITLTYDNTVATTILVNEPAVYLCATAVLKDGTTKTLCEQTDKTKLTQTSATSGKYKITIWPRTLFGLTDAQTIASLTYFITDQTGAKKVGYGNTTTTPFTYRFVCN